MQILLVLLLVAVYWLQNKETDSLLWAINTGDKRYVQEAIDNGADVNKLTQSEITYEGFSEYNPLRLSLDWKSNEVPEVLIKNGADVNYVDENGESLLMVAAGNGDYYKVKMLVDAGADINYSNASGKNAMTYAIKGHYNVYGGAENYEIIKLLYNSGLEIKLADFEEAFKNNNEPSISVMKVLSKLYDDSAKGEIELNVERKSVLDSIYKGDREEIKRYITGKKKIKFYIIGSCVAKDNIEALRYYCEKGGNLQIMSGFDYYENLLTVAAAFDSEKCAGYLLENNVDIVSYKGDEYEEAVSAEEYAEEYGSNKVTAIIRNSDK